MGYFGPRVESSSVIFISHNLGLYASCILDNFKPEKRWGWPWIGKLVLFQMLLGTETRNLAVHFAYSLIFLKHRFRELR